MTYSVNYNVKSAFPIALLNKLSIFRHMTPTCFVLYLLTKLNLYSQQVQPL